MPADIQTILSNPNYYAVKINGNTGITFGLTATSVFQDYGCTAGGAQLIGAYWSIPTGKTITLKWGSAGATAMHLNDSGNLSNEMIAGGISDPTAVPTGNMSVILPTALAANTFYSLILEFGRGPNGQATTTPTDIT